MTNQEKLQFHIENINGDKPLLQPIADHPWESSVVCNAGCTLITTGDELAVIITKLPVDSETKAMLSDQPALVFLLYCAHGEKIEEADFSKSSVGLAILTPEFELMYRHPEPILEPHEKYENLGIEDGRITKVGRRHVLVYTAKSAGESKTNIRIATASTVDFINWIKHGPLKAKFNSTDSRHSMIFERKIGSKFVMLHQPMEGESALAIHWAEAEDVYGEWKTRGLMMKPVINSAAIEKEVSGCAPPLKIPDGRYVFLYHTRVRKKDGSDNLNLGIALGDPGNKLFVAKRFEPLMRRESQPDSGGETAVAITSVSFIGGTYLWKGDLCFPYTDVEGVLRGGRIPKDQLDRFIAR